MAPETRAFDVLIALGTHPPMTEAAINSRLGISAAERVGRYADVRIFNHRWNDPEALVSIGAIDEDEVERISGGLMRERVDVTINKLVLEYDLLLVVGSDLSARGGRLFRRQQVPVSWDLRPGHH